jgi:hypothetical protein
MTDSRKHMDLYTLQTLIMLRTNNDLWDERDIEWAIDNPRHFEETLDSDSIQGEMQEETNTQFNRLVRQRTHEPLQDDLCEDQYTTPSSSNSSRVVQNVGWRPPISMQFNCTGASSNNSSVSLLGVNNAAL